MLRLSLRAKLALVSVALLVLPWAGYQYVIEMERFLLESQRQALLATAKAVATGLHERPRLMRLAAPLRAPEVPADGSDVSGAPVETAIAVPVEIGRASEHEGDRAEHELIDLLRGAERADARLWVVNRELKVLAVAGDLKPAANEAAPIPTWRRWLSWLIRPPARDFDDGFDEDVLTNSREVTTALLGAGGSRVRSSRDRLAVIVSAAQPIWAGDNVVGAVVAEASTNPIVSVRNEALERLLVITLTVFAFVAASQLGFATHLSARIRRLRDEAEGAIDGRGRIARLATASRSGDEVGDLSRSFSSMLSRLAQHHSYLESLASRLSHELRTPVAVVRSSLENLRMGGVAPEARVYLDRAEDGLGRLSRILSRMAEATRLEASLATQEREDYDLVRVVRDCAEGYRLAYPQQSFAVAVPGTVLMVSGSPDLAAQLLDKLVANAADFSAAGQAISIALEDRQDAAVLAVTNHGPLLPVAMAGKLFESMVSVRPAAGGGEGHLGLGLYVARLIAEFHGGEIRADNLPGGDGVRITVRLPRVGGVQLP
jgi:dedicated sortase system histidine kinase